MSLKHDSLASLFTDIADKVRLLKGSSDPIVADDLPAAMLGLPLPAVEEEFVEKTCTHNTQTDPVVHIWRQLGKVQNSVAEVYGITRTKVDELTMHYSGTSSRTTGYTGTTNIYFTQGHEYYIAVNAVPTGCTVSGVTTFASKSKIFSYTTASDYNNLGIYIPSGVQIDDDVRFYVIDLTDLYGAGNEPTTVAQFEADYPNYNPAYNPGSALNTAPELNVKKVYGKSVIWRQLFNEANFHSLAVNTAINNSSNIPSFAVSNGTCYITKNEDGYVQVKHIYYGLGSPSSPSGKIDGHKYLIKGKFRFDTSTDATQLASLSQAFYGDAFQHKGEWVENSVIITADNTTRMYVPLYHTQSDKNIYIDWQYCHIIDLTDYFGAGNEPTTIAEVRKYFPADYYPYDPGSLQSNKTAELRAERIPVINVWDEEWELGAISSSNGNNVPSSTDIRSKNLIPLNAGSTYYFKGPIGVNLRYYDENKAFLSSYNAVINPGSLFTTPSGAAYVRFWGAGTTYNHDICINLSDPAINGQYYPHWRGSLALNLSTLTSGGVVVFPYGMCRVGDIRDEAEGSTAIVRVGRVDLGTLYWTAFSGVPNAFTASVPGKAFGLTNFVQSKYTLTTDTVANMPDKTIKGNNSGTPIYVKDTAYPDAATFKAAMSGVMLDYPLATPLTYTLDTPIVSGSSLPLNVCTVDMGDMTWEYSSSYTAFYTETINKIILPAVSGDYASRVSGLWSDYFTANPDVQALSQLGNKEMMKFENGTVWVKDTGYTDPATFKAAMKGHWLRYVLLNPQYMLTAEPLALQCQQNDILKRVSDNNCPFVGEIEYKL